jgi:1-phosphofructokinase
MIVTFTANPCIEHTLVVSQFELNHVNRAVSSHRNPAGKGITVSRALAKKNVATVAIFPSDGANGAWIVNALKADNVETLSTLIRDGVRTNVTVVDESGHTTKVNEIGPTITSSEEDAIAATLVSALAVRPAWLVLAGSLPPGLGSGFYAEMGRVAREHGVRVAVDGSGAAFAEAVHSGVADFLKPNHSELEELSGRRLPTIGDVVNFAQSLLRDDECSIVVSLGARGALGVTGDNYLWAVHEPVSVESTVGAGDCAVAGYLSADIDCRRKEIGGEEGLTVRLATAVAWGSAAVQLPLATMPGPDDVTMHRVHLHPRPDESTLIKDL